MNVMGLLYAKEIALFDNLKPPQKHFGSSNEIRVPVELFPHNPRTRRRFGG